MSIHSNQFSELIHQIFEQLADCKNSHIAFEDFSQEAFKRWSYGEINGAANELGQRLLKITGGEKELPIAILLSSRVEILISSLAVLKAGCAFVPLSPQYPTKRIFHILKELERGQGSPPLLIAKESEPILVDVAKERIPHKFIPFKNMDEEIGEGRTNLNLKDISPSSLAYVIFTSGSTGSPKGVMIDNNSFVSRILSFIQTYSIQDDDRSPLFLNPSFDASLLETWGMLLGRATIFCPPEHVRTDPTAFHEFILGHSLTRAVLPASFAQLFWKVSMNGNCQKTSLKTLFVGGEQLTRPSVFSNWNELGYDVVNCYGPTETTIQVASINLSQEEGAYDKFRPPIGSPIKNVLFKVDGSGELWIGGCGLAKGYWANASLTEQKFVEDGEGVRWFRSGDVVSRCPISGHYSWLRRLDDQLKVGGGFLVEPVEIEATILKFFKNLGVDGAKALVVDKHLVAFVILSKTNNLNNKKDLGSILKAGIADHLPPYMIPSFVIPIPNFPTTPNGKVDKVWLEQEFRNWLKIKENNSNPNKGIGSVKERGERWLEKSLATIWGQVLELPEKMIETASDIFQIGADSLRMSEFGALLKKELGIDLHPDFMRVKAGHGLGVNKMAEILRGESKSKNLSNFDSHSMIVPLREEHFDTEIPTLIFFHPDNGSLFCYKTLIYRLSSVNYNIYGIQDTVNAATGFSSVQEMAGHYVDFLSKKFPKKRLILAGYRFGGYLAWEVAASMQRSKVDLVFMFDTYLPPNLEAGKEIEILSLYQKSRSSCKGLKVPSSRVETGVHMFKLGLQYKPTKVCLNLSPKVVVIQGMTFLDSNTSISGNLRWGLGQNMGQVHEIDTQNREVLEEPNADHVASLMQKYICGKI